MVIVIQAILYTMSKHWDSFLSYCIRATNIPLTPESARQWARATDRLQQLQMTDPDDRHSRSRSRTPLVPSPVILQPNFLADDIDDLDATPGPHSMPMLPRLNL